jgi:flagellar assembly protein FliH
MLPVQTSGSGAHVAELERRIVELQASSDAEMAKIRHTAFQDGMRQGREEATSAVNDCAEKLGRTLADLMMFKRRMRSDAEREIVKLSLAIARRILYRELATDPDALQGLIHAALSKLQNRDIWQVRISPHGAEVAKSYLESAGMAATIKLVIDRKLRPGDLLIDTAAGELDASVDTQLQEVERGFADRLPM